jgi:hypothetical protein
MANGWTAERKARQAQLIRTWRPWERSTGPKTQQGKARSSRNADKPDSLNRQIQNLKNEVKRLVRQSKDIRDLFTR